MRHTNKALLPNDTTVAHAPHKYARHLPSEGSEVWNCVDKGGEPALLLLERIARRKLVSWTCRVCGDFSGKLLPRCDGDVVAARENATSRFLRGPVNGLSCRLSACCRCPEDRPPFRQYHAIVFEAVLAASRARGRMHL